MEENVSVTIEMPMSRFKELEAEMGLKVMMETTNLSVSMVEKMAVAYLMAVRNGEKTIKFKAKGG